MTAQAFQKIAHTLPNSPGIYKYFDEKGKLIYVGKAKELKKRISSYFLKNQHSFKTIELVQKIASIEFTLVDSEQDAFLLENSLIKEHQPKYNISLKDDKTYPFITIKNEPFPRVFLTRKKINDGSEYLGPFTSGLHVRELLSFIKQIIPTRNCKLNLSEKNIQKGNFKVCLEYHLGNCLGPCENLQTAADYQIGIDSIKNILKGNLAPIIHQYKKEMQEYANQWDFEKAAIYKKKLADLENYQAKSIVVSTHFQNLDVFSFLREDNLAYVNYLMVQNGSIIQTHTVHLETQLAESDEEVLAFAITNLRNSNHSLAKEIIVPFPIALPGELSITIPKAGEKKKLLDLSEKNVFYFKQEITRKRALHLENKTDQQIKDVLYQLQALLHLPAAPLHIECFDNSNFQGSSAVSAMVCFKNGVPNKENYRKYHVNTVEGIDDFKTMSEVVYRRYKKVLANQEPLPDLIIIDGGKGQLSSAMTSIQKLGIADEVVMIGLAKNQEEVFFPGDTESFKLPWNSDSLNLLRRIRDEVHRFGIEFHRHKRSKAALNNTLIQIPGVGKKSMETLLKKFKSVKNIKTKTLAELAEQIGQSKALLVKSFLENS